MKNKRKLERKTIFGILAEEFFCVSFCALFYYLFSRRIFFRQFHFSFSFHFFFWMELSQHFPAEVANVGHALVGVTGLWSVSDPVVHTTTTMGATVSLPMSVLPSAGRDALEAQIWDTLSLRKTPSGATRTPPLHFILLPKQSSQLPPKKTRNPPLAAVSPSPAASPAPQNGPAHPLEDPLLHPTTTHPAMTGVPPSASMPSLPLVSPSTATAAAAALPPHVTSQQHQQQHKRTGSQSQSQAQALGSQSQPSLTQSLLGMTHHSNASTSSLTNFLLSTSNSQASISLAGPHHHQQQVAGILKANWLHKHFAKQPGLVLSFFHFDPFDGDWRNRDGVMINEILERKRALQERGIRVVVVLLTSETSRPTQEMKAPSQERMAILKNSCSLDKSSLFIYSGAAAQAGQPPPQSIRDFLIKQASSSSSSFLIIPRSLILLTLPSCPPPPPLFNPQQSRKDPLRADDAVLPGAGKAGEAVPRQGGLLGAPGLGGPLQLQGRRLFRAQAGRQVFHQVWPQLPWLIFSGP